MTPQLALNSFSFTGTSSSQGGSAHRSLFFAGRQRGIDVPVRPLPPSPLPPSLARTTTGSRFSKRCNSLTLSTVMTASWRWRSQEEQVNELLQQFDDLERQVAQFYKKYDGKDGPGGPTTVGAFTRATTSSLEFAPRGTAVNCATYFLQESPEAMKAPVVDCQKHSSGALPRYVVVWMPNPLRVRKLCLNCLFGGRNNN